MLALLVCLVALLAAADANPPATELERNIQSFKYVWQTVRDNHWDPNYNGIDWQAVHDELRPQIEKADTRGKARAVLQEMIHRLRQTHFGIIPEEFSPRREGGASILDGEIGLDVRLVGESVLITAVLKGSSAEAMGIRPGWELLAVDGQEAAPFLGELRKWVSSPLLIPWVARGEALDATRGKPGTVVRLRLSPAAGVAVELSVTRTERRGERTQIGYLPPAFVRAEFLRLDVGVGYLAFNLFANPPYLMQFIEQAIASCLDCRGFVIDLRGNGGGLGAMATGIAGWFIEEQRSLGTIYTRGDRPNLVVYPRPRTYRGPVAVLIDGCSVSAAEFFALGMKETGRARLFGQRTAGAALPSTMDKLPNGDLFQYAFAGYASAGGKTIEGVGVAPDVEVQLTREALFQGRDPALEAALEWLGKQK